MDTLKDLINVVNKKAIKRVEVMGNSTNYSSKMRELYDGIAEGKFETDHDAAQALYDGDENDANYKKLKYRLEKRLINTAFFIDLNKPGYTDEAKANISCYRNMMAAYILNRLGIRKTGAKIAQKTLNQAIRFEFSNISYRMCTYLRNYYGTIVGDLKKMDHYHERSMYYFQIAYYENIAEGNLSKLVALSYRSDVDKTSLEKMAINFLEETQEVINEYTSNTLLRLYHLIRSIRYQLVNDYRNLLIASNDAIQYFSSKAAYRTLASFCLWKLLCCIQLKKYEEAEKAIAFMNSFIDKGSINYFSALEYQTLLYFHSKKFQKVYEIIASTANDKRLLREMPGSIREHWLLYEAYANLFVKMGKIDSSLSKYQLERFKLSRFLNEVPIYSMEKRRANIPVLIIQILFMLQQKKFSQVVDRMDALNAYCYRYLRKDETFRSNVFIKMLLQIPKANFHREAVVRKTKQLRERLDNVPLEVARQSSEIEIIPYEDLWEYVLEMLSHRFHYV